MLTPAQCRSARGLIEWSQTKLANSAGLSLSTVRDFETGKRQPMANNLKAMMAAFDAAGVVFLGTGETADGGEGVRRRKGE